MADEKTREKPTVTWADVAELLSRIMDRLNSLEKRVDVLEMHVYATIEYPSKPEE
jgi:hypothetical protein